MFNLAHQFWASCTYSKETHELAREQSTTSCYKWRTKEKSLGGKHGQHFSQYYRITMSRTQLERRLPTTHACLSPSALRPLEETWQQSERGTGDAPASFKPHAWKRFASTCTMSWKRERRRLTDKSNNNWFTPAAGLFFWANSYCKVLAFTSIIGEVSWKRRAMDELHRLLAEHLPWLTTQDRL